MDETTVNHGRTEGASGGALVALVFGLFGICAVAAAAIAYGLYPGYIDHGEPTVAIQSWRLLQGEPVYLPFEAAERTSNLYGPWLFLIHAGAFWAAGPSLWAGKLAALAAAAALPVLVFRGERRCGPAVAGWMAFLAACYVFLAAPGSLWGRPDPFLALAALAAIRLAEDDRAATPSGAALFGLVCGLAVGMKLFAAIYFVAPALWIAARHGWRPVARTGVVAVAVAAAPFALPIFDAAAFLSWFGPMAGKPHDPALAVKTAIYLAFYLLPPVGAAVVLAWRGGSSRSDRGEALFAVGAVVALVPAFYLATKTGGAAYYLYPFFPAALFLARRFAVRADWPRSAAWPLLALLAAIVVLPLHLVRVHAERWSQLDAAAAEIAAIAAARPGQRIEIGVGAGWSSYFKVWQQPRLVLAGHPFTLDHGIVMETTAFGAPLGDATLAAIGACATDVWLVPAGEEPFAMPGYYGRPVYDERFRRAFLSAYGMTERRTHFDVWSCRRP